MSASNSFGISQQRSSPETVSPFGNRPYRAARGYDQLFAGPLARGLGFGADTPANDRFNRRLEGATGPTADYIRDVRGLAPGVIDSATSIGRDIAGRAPAAYSTLMSEVDKFLGSLPGFQATAGRATAGGETALGGATDALGYARRMTDEAFSPISDQALFQQAGSRALEGIAPGLAGRGILGGGAGAAAEEQLFRDLGFDFANRARDNQGSAIDRMLAASTGVGGASANLAGLGRNEADLARMGVDVGGVGLAALPQLQSLLQSEYSLPMAAAGDLFGLLSGGTAPLMSLLQAISPVVAQKSKGYSTQGSNSVGI